MKALVLVVDNDPAYRFACACHLSQTGYGMEEAASLEEARAILLLHRFGALILDLDLPDGNGIDWISNWKQGYPEMAIIVVSGMTHLGAECLQRGADDFHSKPASLEDLDASLHKSLTKSHNLGT